MHQKLMNGMVFFLVLILVLSSVVVYLSPLNENIKGKAYSTEQGAETMGMQSNLAENQKVYVYGPGGRLAKFEATKATYYHSDHLGSTSLATDENGEVVFEGLYEPFGGDYVSQGEERYKYTGQEQDNTGLYYYGARYYDPSIGRFMAVDPVAGNIYNPQRLNAYTYVLNNPFKFVDPSGGSPQLSQVMININSYLGSPERMRASREGITNYMKMVGFMEGNPHNNVGNLLDVQSSLPRPVSITFFVSMAYQEGYLYYSHNQELGVSDYPQYGYEGWPIGVDFIFSSMDALKKGDYLRQSFQEGVDYNLRRYDNGELSTISYEKGESVIEGYFLTGTGGLESMGALFFQNSDSFLRDAKNLGIDTSSLSERQINGWSYIYYNSGSGSGRTLLREQGIGALDSSQHKAAQNARRILGTQEVLDRSGIFEE